MTRFRDLIAPYRTEVLAEATGKQASWVSKWRLKDGPLPSIIDLPTIAAVLRMDLGELTRVVAAERAARKESANGSQG